MSTAIPSIEDLIPHRGVMCLLDRAEEIGPSSATAWAQVREDWPIPPDDPSCAVLMIELVAQCVAVVYGWRKRQGGEYTAGFLVGVKQAEFHCQGIPPGTWLKVSVQALHEMEGYGVFHGVVQRESQTLAQVEIQAIIQGEES